MAATPLQLLALIADAHRDMLAARAAVVDALGLADAPPLVDPLAELVAFLEDGDARHAARIAEAVAP